MVALYARSERSIAHPLPPSTGQYPPVPARLAHKVAHPLPEPHQAFPTGYDARKDRFRLRVALLTFIALSERRHWPNGPQVGGGQSTADYFAPFNRALLTRFLAALALTPRAPVISKALSSIERDGLADFYPLAEGRGRLPRTKAKITRSGVRVVEDNLIALIPPDFETRTRSLEGYDSLAEALPTLPTWALETVIPTLFEDLAARFADKQDIE